MLYLPGLKKLIEEAKKNRFEFLEPYRKRVEDLQSLLSDPDKKVVRNAEKKISTTVIYLLKIEPSHLDEVWICKIIQSWMKDATKVDDLHGAFIPQKGRDRKTPDQQSIDAKGKIFYFKVQEHVSNGLTITDAIKKISEKCQEYREKHPEDPPFMKHDDGYLWKMYHKTAKKIKEEDAKKELPWPYYGKDIFQETDGTYTLTGKGIITFQK